MLTPTPAGLRDCRGRSLALPRPPRRVVSLAPSLTETVFALGAGERLVGRTRWCVHPDEAANVAVVGGTKDPDLERVLALGPDVVLANREENRAEDVRELEARVPVFVTYPRTVDESRQVVLDVAGILGDPGAAEPLVAAIDRARSAVRDRRPRRLRVVPLIWRRPYLTVSADTYAGSLLAESGGDNPFAGDPCRYPEVGEERLREAGAEALLLATEPFHFGEDHRRELLEARLAPVVRVVDGELLAWWGVRTAAGLSYVVGVLASVCAELAAPPAEGVRR